MATQTGTATDWLDLYTKLRDFLTTDATLTGAGENWTQIAGNGGVLVDGDEIVLQGPGSSGSDEILVGIKTYSSVASDYYNLALYGLTAWNPGQGGIVDQVNRSAPAMIHLWDQTLDYWFIANGRRFIVIARVSTVYQCGYAGFILPYVLPTLWPYPLFVGGCSGITNWRWSEATPEMAAFFDPGEGCAQLLFPDVIWRNVANFQDSGGSQNPLEDVNTHPYRWDEEQLRDNLDGTYTLEPVSLTSQVPYPAQLGKLQGVFRVSGFGNAAENIVTESTVDHLVINSVFRTTWKDYAAFALE